MIEQENFKKILGRRETVIETKKIGQTQEERTQRMNTKDEKTTGRQTHAEKQNRRKQNTKQTILRRWGEDCTGVRGEKMSPRLVGEGADTLGLFAFQRSIVFHGNY